MKLKRSKIFIYSVFFIFFLILPQKIGEHHRWQRYCDWIIANSAMAEQHLIEKPFRLSNEMKGSNMKHPKLKTKIKHLLISRKKMKLICFFFTIYKKRKIFLRQRRNSPKLNRKCGAIEFMNMFVWTNISRAPRASLFMRMYVFVCVTGDAFHTWILMYLCLNSVWNVLWRWWQRWPLFNHW